VIGASNYVGRLYRTLFNASAALLSTTLIVAAGALAAKTAGFGKELIIAYKLGAGPQLDAFLYAYLFPVFLINIFGGAVVASFVPRYLATEAQVSPQAARKLAGESAVLVVAATIVLVLFAMPIAALLVPRLARGFDANTQEATIRLLPVLMPLVAISVVTSLWAGLLNANGKFSAVAFVPAITPLVVVCALFLQVVSSDAMSLAVGTLVGATIEIGILAQRARAIGFDLFVVPRRWRPEYGQILRQFVPAAASTLLMSLTIVIDQSFAANLPVGSVSVLSYGTKLTNVASSILVVIVSTLALPAFSRLAAEGDFVALRRAFVYACAIVALVTIPIAVVLSVGAEPILHLLFRRGSFTSDDAMMAASVQRLHAWHLPAYVLSLIAVRALAAICETWVMLVGSVANLAVDILVNVLFVPLLGVAGIGLASTAMYVTSSFVLCIGFLLRVRSRTVRSVAH
jgi:putative peptidoglycan lipid II flippase